MPIDANKLVNIAHNRVNRKYDYLFNHIHDDLVSIFILHVLLACKKLDPKMSVKQKISYVLMKGDYGLIDTVYGKKGEAEFYKKHRQLEHDVEAEEKKDNELEQELIKVFKLLKKREKKLFILLICGHKSEDIIKILDIPTLNTYHQIVHQARKKILNYLKSKKIS